MRDYVLLLFVVGLVPFIIWRAWIGALAWTWIGLMNPHLYAWSLATFPFAQVIGLSLLVGWVIDRDKKFFPPTLAIVSLGTLLVYIILKTPFAWNQDVAWGYCSQFTKVILAAFLIATIIHSPTRVRWFIWTIIVSIGVAYGVKGGIFALASGGQERVQGPEPSFIGGNTHLGVALIMVLPLYVAFIRDTASAWWRRAAVAGFWLTIVGIVFTYSRGAWVGMAPVGALLFLQAKRKVLIAAALVPLALVAVAFIPSKLFDRMDTIAEYKEDLSALQRIQGWGVAFNVATRHPLGAGFILDATPVPKWMEYANFTHPAFNRANAAHSIYFQLLGDQGFPGLFLFLVTIFATFVTLYRVWRQARGDPELEWVSHYAIAVGIGLVGYMCSGAFVSLGYFDLFYTYVVLSAILLREVRTVLQRRLQKPGAAARPIVSVGQPASTEQAAAIRGRALANSTGTRR